MRKFTTYLEIAEAHHDEPLSDDELREYGLKVILTQPINKYRHTFFDPLTDEQFYRFMDLHTYCVKNYDTRIESGDWDDAKDISK